MGYSTLSQIILIIIAVIVIVIYIKPQFAETNVLKDEIAQYETAVDNATRSNQQLSELATRASQISADDIESLDKFIGKEMDSIAVMRDIQILGERRGLDIQSITVTESEGGRSATEVIGKGSDTSIKNIAERIVPLRINFSFSGTYQQLKNVLSDFERNGYPLEVVSLSFGSSAVNNYNFSMVLEAYGLDID